MLTLIALTVTAIFMMGLTVGFFMARDVRPVIRPTPQAGKAAFNYWLQMNGGK